MPQLSLYLDEPTMEELRADAAEAGLSLSKYVTGLIREKKTHRGWPEGYWEQVYGCITDPTFVVPPELDADLDEIVLFD